MEEQLNLAEERLKQLESRLISVETVRAADGSCEDGALRKYQAVVLTRLKAVREALLEEGGDIEALRKERDHAAALNRKYEAEISKQNYRIAHLIKALNEAQKKN